MNNSVFNFLLAGLDSFRIFTVVSLTDSLTAIAGDGSLRGQVMAANNAGGGIVNFSSELSGTILLDSQGNENFSGIVISSDAVIVGPGKSTIDVQGTLSGFPAKTFIAIDGQNSGNVFYVLTPTFRSVTAGVFGVTIQNSSKNNASIGPAIDGGGGYGVATVNIANCVFSNNIAGAINFTGISNIDNCSFIFNSNGVYLSSTQGPGAIFNGGVSRVTNCLFYGNQSSLSGGAIQNDETATINILNSVFKRNGCHSLNIAFGGAIFNYGTGSVDRCWFSENIADNGGAITSVSATFFITNSTVIHNTIVYASFYEFGVLIGGISVQGINYISGDGNFIRYNHPF